MTAAEELLNRVTVASPCSEPWEKMKGDERVRFCGKCQLNVYFLSGMHSQEAAELVRRHEGKLCVRFYVRPDGTMLTRDCPVGLAAVRRRLAAAAAILLAALAGLFGTSIRRLSFVDSMMNWLRAPATQWAPDRPVQPNPVVRLDVITPAVPPYELQQGGGGARQGGISAFVDPTQKAEIFKEESPAPQGK